MIASKHITKIVAIMVCLCLLFCWFIVYAAENFDTTKITEYQKRIFGNEIISLEIQVDESEWQAMMSNAQAKEWISADLIINGERFQSVGIRTKGNSSLSQMGGSRGGGGSSNNRYSLQFKFNKFVKGQTYYGLDTFAVNNMMGDATYMKDYLAYDIMNFIGVDTPLTGYANITVNGESYGFGIALERYDKAFLDRVYSTSAGQLYNVKIQMGQRGNFEDMWQDIPEGMPGRGQRGDNGEFPGRPQRGDGGGFPDMPQDGMDFGNRQQGGNRQPRDSNAGFPDMPDGMDFGGRGGMGMGGFGGGRGGGSLVYTDNEISSYSAIFDNAIFNNSSNKDKQRVITALENLNAGTDLEKHIDVDATLRYFAAHTVVVNLDSYTSNMAQNYYLYERDGKLTILPWDYNLSFGGFQSGNASSVVNFPIDTPVSGVSMEDRPLLNMLLEVDEYRERYHDYLRQIVEDYFESGQFENTIRNLDAKINEYIKNDVKVFYTYEQYEASLPVMIELGHLRAESIKGQLDGSIPSTSSGQREDASSLIDASGINLSALGSMMGGGGRGGWQGGEDGMQGGMPDGMFDMDMGLMMQAMQILMEHGGELTDDAKKALLELGITEEQIEMFVNMQNGFRGGGMFGGFPGNDGQSPPSDGAEQGGRPDRQPDRQEGQQGEMPSMPPDAGANRQPPGQNDGQGERPAMPDRQPNGQDGFPPMPENWPEGMPSMPDGFPGGRDGMPQMPEGFPEGLPDDWQTGNRGGPGGRERPPGGQDGFPAMPDGRPDRQEPDNNAGQTVSTNNDWQISFLSAADSGGGQGTPPTGNIPPQGNMSNGDRTRTPPGATAQTGIDTGYAITVGVLMLILIGAIIFVAWPRKNVI